MMRRMRLYLVSAVIIALAATVVYLRFAAGRAGTLRRTLDAPAIVREIQPLQELVTVRYTVQKIVGLKEEKVPFGAESVLLMVQAKVLAGVDLSAVRESDVHVADDGTVSIRLPVAQILHVYVDDRQTQVWDRSKTWWTPWVPFNAALEQKARLAALEAVQITALEMGILRDAQQLAETAIRKLLTAAGVSSVSFTTGSGRD